MSRRRDQPQKPIVVCGLPDGCEQTSPTEWRFANGAKVVDTGRSGARRFRWEAATDQTFTHTGSIATAFRWAAGETKTANRYASREPTTAGLDVLTAVRKGATTPRDIAERAGYSEACVYYTLRQLLAAGAVVRARIARVGGFGPAPFAYRVAA